MLLERSGYEKFVRNRSLRASSPIWASEASLARTRELAAKARGAPRSRVLARLTSLAQIGEVARRLKKSYHPELSIQLTGFPTLL